MQKLTYQLAGQLGETLALAKFIAVGLHAYVSPPGAPGHDIIVVTPNGPKSVEVKTRQFIERPSEISLAGRHEDEGRCRLLSLHRA